MKSTLRNESVHPCTKFRNSPSIIHSWVCDRFLILFFAYYFMTEFSTEISFECMQYNCTTFFLDCTLCGGFVYHVSDPHQSAAWMYILSLSSVETQGSITLQCFWKGFISLLELQPIIWSDGCKEKVTTNFLYSDKTQNPITAV